MSACLQSGVSLSPVEERKEGELGLENRDPGLNIMSKPSGVRGISGLEPSEEVPVYRPAENKST